MWKQNFNSGKQAARELGHQERGLSRDGSLEINRRSMHQSYVIARILCTSTDTGQPQT